MTPERFRFLEPIVQAALDLEDEPRADFLTSVCGSDSSLQEDVEALIEAYRTTATRTEEPEPVPLADRPERVGPYRILKLLGEGGMGSVFLARQTEPIRRQVALKLIRPDMVSREVIRRFEVERQALARMNHPHIARAFEAGATAQGQPYFVMEYVQGQAITDYCDRHRLGVRARLELLIAVCEGIQHAHEKGVLHRDVKPSNILITEDQDRPTPKIIDFGIAKALDQPFTEGTIFTGTRLIGTPAYLSPEALKVSEWGLDVDTRSDVYSLGVLLYELLVGVVPFEIRSESLLQMIQRITEEEAPTPSARLAALGGEAGKTLAHNLGVETPALARRLRGDIDWITVKAIAKQRSQRYGSAAELAADLERHLSNEPVLAGPPSGLYRAGKFVRRHKAAVVATLLIALALLVAAVGTSLQAERANREAERANQEASAARQVSQFLVDLFEESDPSEARGQAVTARELLDRGAEKIREENVEQPLTQARLMHTIGTVYRQMGLFEPATPLLADAAELREQLLGGEHADVAESLYHLAACYVGEDRYEEAEVTLQRVVAIREQALGPDHPDTASGLNALGDLYFRRGRYRQAESRYERVLEIWERALGPEHKRVAIALYNLGLVYLSEGRQELAEPRLARALATFEAFEGEDHPTVATISTGLAACYFELGRYDQARALHQRALGTWERVLGPDHFEVARSLNNLAEIEWLLGRYEEAESLFERALAIAREALGSEHLLVSHPLHGLATLYRDQGRAVEAEDLYRRALAIRENMLEPEHSDLHKTLREYASLLRSQGRVSEAEELEARIRSEDGL